MKGNVSASPNANTTTPRMSAVSGLGTSAKAPALTATTPKPTSKLIASELVSLAAKRRSRSASTEESFPSSTSLERSSVIFTSPPIFRPRRRHVVGAAPDMHLLLAPSLAGVVLVEARQVAIVALVERKVSLDWNLGLAEVGQDQIERVLRANQHRGKSDIEFQPLLFQLAAGFFRFSDALFCEIGILPAGEEVFQVPFALAVAHEYEKAVAHFLSVQNSRNH